MVVIQSLSTAGGAAKRNPILFVVTAALGLLQIPGMVAQSINQTLGIIVSNGLSGVMLLVMPFIFGGLIAMTDESIDGQTSIDTLIAKGKENYLSILAVYFGLFAVYFVIGMIGSFAIIFGGVFVIGFGSGSGGLSLMALVVITVIGLLGILVCLGPIFLFQFFVHAIVLDGMGPVDSLKRSASCVQQNLVTVFGYNLIVGTVGLIAGVFSMLISLSSSPVLTELEGSEIPAMELLTSIPTIGTAGVVGLSIVFVLGSAFTGGIFSVYSTVIYRSIQPTA